MNDTISSETDEDFFPDPVLKPGKKNLSLIWIVPLIAALIGGWLIYKALSEKGPEVTIRFKTAEGIEAGKTRIRYKDVEVGLVTRLSLSPDLMWVMVQAQFVKGAESYLTENTRFWVVRPRVAAFGVSGLSTLFSGAYIDLDPGKPGKTSREFNGLEEPPIVTTVDPGRVFVLNADRKGSIEIGSPVYYRQIMVGKVIAYHLADDGSHITFRIFINSPFDQYVHRNSRFWNASGLNVRLDAQGIGIQTESWMSLMVGGITFDVLDTFEPLQDTAEENSVFDLHPSREAALKKSYIDKTRYMLYFSGSVRGLSPGAPVEFRGIPIGEVVDLRMEYDADQKTFEIPVVIVIEPGRIYLKKGTRYNEKERVIDFLVAKGFRAQLKSGNLVTGQQYISLDFFPDAPPARVLYGDTFPVIPTMPTPIEEIGSKIGHLIAKIEKIPIDQISGDIRDTIQGAKEIVRSPEVAASLRSLRESLGEIQKLAADLRLQTLPEAQAALRQARTSLAASGSLLDSDSPLQLQLQEGLREVSAAAQSLRSLLDYLERHPESILQGKGKEK
jgi:paraquat-inducible protein B